MEKTETIEAEKPQGSLAEVGAEVEKARQKEAVLLIGENVDFNELKFSPNKLDEVIKKFWATWENLSKRIFGGNIGKAFDRFCAVLAPTGLKPSEIDRPASKLAEAEDPKKTETIKEKNKTRALNARNILQKNPAWITYILQSSAAHGIPEPTIISFIEMESSFNPNVRPLDSQGKPVSSALGLSQALFSTFREYQNNGHPNAERENPKDAIDFVAWYCKHLITTVNALIDSNEADPKFKLTPADTRNLYLAYHDGPGGYLALRKYQENPTLDNFNKLKWWQRRSQEIAGKTVFDYETTNGYASRVSEVALAYKALPSITIA